MRPQCAAAGARTRQVGGRKAGAKHVAREREGDEMPRPDFLCHSGEEKKLTIVLTARNTGVLGNRIFKSHVLGG